MRLINLIPLHEIDFPSQAAFDTYSKNHKLRPTTKVKIAGKTTTAGQASKIKGTSVFSKDNTKNIFHKQDKPKDSQNPQTTIKNIADLTDNNDHNAAVMALAKMMNDKSYIAIMEKIQKYHELNGHMPQSIIKYRTDIMKNLLVKAERRYGNKIAKQLQNSF